MAFATGSGPAVADFLDAFQAFAVSQGWTINAYVRGDYIKISNGITKAMIVTTSRNVGVSTGTRANGTYSTVPDAGLYGRLCTGFTADKQDPYHQPGAPIDPNNYWVGAVSVWDLAGPLTQWFFFSGNAAAGDPPYIHCVVQTSGERYTHMSIGQVDKKNLTHSGAAYLVGHGEDWWQESRLDDYDFNRPFHYPSKKSFPFGGTANNLYVPDALPSGPEWTTMVPQALPTVILYDTPTAIFSDNYNARLCSAIGISAPSSYAGFNVLWALPAIVKSSINRLCYVGDYPNVRGCNMETLFPGQEIALGSDIWKIFPVQRQANWSTVGNDTQATTAQYALAYKKV